MMTIFGWLATEKASSPDVKQFGQRMVNDHSKANDQLKHIAVDEGVTLRCGSRLTAENEQSANLRTLLGL